MSERVCVRVGNFDIDDFTLVLLLCLDAAAAAPLIDTRSTSSIDLIPLLLLLLLLLIIIIFFSLSLSRSPSGRSVTQASQSTMVPPVFQRLSALTVGLCFLVFLTTPALATITIESSGKRIPSTPDSLMGDVFDDEHYIPARLQFLPDNIDLCAGVLHPHRTYQITVPIDRRPGECC